VGDTIEKIAFEKAGIIRPNIPVVFGDNKSLKRLSIKRMLVLQNFMQ
jgi:folylpolyglutamate synthase/dihydropteroate synthase